MCGDLRIHVHEVELLVARALQRDDDLIGFRLQHSLTGFDRGGRSSLVATSSASVTASEWSSTMSSAKSNCWIVRTLDGDLPLLDLPEVCRAGNVEDLFIDERWRPGHAGVATGSAADTRSGGARCGPRSGSRSAAASGSRNRTPVLLDAQSISRNAFSELLERLRDGQDVVSLLPAPEGLEGISRRRVLKLLGAALLGQQDGAGLLALVSRQTDNEVGSTLLDWATPSNPNNYGYAARTMSDPWQIREGPWWVMKDLNLQPTD